MGIPFALRQRFGEVFEYLTWLPLRKTTRPAPAAVSPHVSSVPSKACVTALYPSIIVKDDLLLKDYGFCWIAQEEFK